MYDSGHLKIDIEDNFGLAKKELKKKKQIIFHEWGMKWLRLVVRITPRDTGELRKANAYKLQQNHVLFYNTKEYATYVNNGTRKMKGAKFFERSIMERAKVYEKIAKKIMEE